MDDDDPWAAADLLRDVPETEDPGGLSEGATVESIDRYPIFGTGYRCQTWMAHYPWTLNRRSTVRVYRGDWFNNPELIGETVLRRLTRNGAEVLTVTVGMTADEPRIEVFLDGDLPVETGDILVFSDLPKQ